MPRQPLPPDVLTRLVAEYEKTGNVSETARRLNVPRETVRDALRRLGTATRRQLHARACEAGLRQGRRALRAELRRLTTYTTTCLGDADAPGIEPRDYAALVRAQADLNRVLIGHDERVSARRTEKLQRDLVRAKLEAIRSLPSDLAGATDEELATVRAILERARTRGPTASDTGRAGEADASEPSDG